jgi:uncharacterized membrane protein HdeD (DUF308 family)
MSDGNGAAPIGAPRDPQETAMTALEETTAPRLSTRNKVGFVIAFIMGLIDIPSVFESSSGSGDGPPVGILAIGTVCGLVTVVAVVWAWRTLNRKATRIAAAARIVSILTSLPAFFVDVPAGLKVFVAAGVILTVVAVTLMLTPPRERLIVTD